MQGNSPTFFYKGFNTMEQVWFEKYRPSKIEDYVWRDESQKETMTKWVEQKEIPHVIFQGLAGTGKSSAINVLINEIEVDKGDILYIDASTETSVDVVREKVINFASTIPWGNFKVCILEEADALSKNAQNSLKRTIEDYSDNCRFIFTTNNPHKIDPAIHSRCQSFHIERLDEETFLGRMIYILSDNDIDFDEDTLLSYFKGTYPDLRKAINELEKNSNNGKLHNPSTDSKAKIDYMVLVADHFKKGKITEAREILVKEATENEYIEIYRFLYRNLDFWSSEVSRQDEALIAIRDGMYKDNFVADREINLSATLATLAMIEG